MKTVFFLYDGYYKKTQHEAILSTDFHVFRVCLQKSMFHRSAPKFSKLVLIGYWAEHLYLFHCVVFVIQSHKKER